MSVSLLIVFKSPDREELYLPVANAAGFERYWRRTADKLGLERIQQFEWRTSFEPHELPAIAAELATLREEFKRLGENRLWENIDFILAALSPLDPTDLKEVCCI